MVTLQYGGIGHWLKKVKRILWKKKYPCRLHSTSFPYYMSKTGSQERSVAFYKIVIWFIAISNLIIIPNLSINALITYNLEILSQFRCKLLDNIFCRQFGTVVKRCLCLLTWNLNFPLSTILKYEGIYLLINVPIPKNKNKNM